MFNLLIILSGGRFSRPYDSAFFATNEIISVYFGIVIVIVLIIAYLKIKSNLYRNRMAKVSKHISGNIYAENELNDTRLTVIIKDRETDEELFTLFSDIFDKAEAWISITNSNDINENVNNPVVNFALDKFIELSRSAGFSEIISEIDLYEMYNMKLLSSFYKSHNFAIEYKRKENIAIANFKIIH